MKITAQIIDYNKMIYWQAHPAKINTNDSFLNVDIFYVHSNTFFNGPKRNGNINRQVYGRKVQIKLSNQLSVFQGLANVYAPSYREVRLNTFLWSKDKKRIPAIEFAYQDIKNAFEQYLKTWNKGKPIILVAHGQGVLHAQRILAEYFSNESNLSLIVAYLPGYQITTELSSTKNYCQDSSETNCIVGWQTYGKYAKFKEKGKPLFWNGKTYLHSTDSLRISTNPLTWKVNQDTMVSRNVTALRPTVNERIPLKMEDYDCRTTVQNGRLLVFGENRLLFNSTGDNHYAYDYNLFYSAIRENVQFRIKSYFFE